MKWDDLWFRLEQFDASKEGWYAILHCYDAAEGIFDCALESDQVLTHRPLGVIVGVQGPFKTEQEAADYADKWNPDNRVDGETEVGR